MPDVDSNALESPDPLENLLPSSDVELAGCAPVLFLLLFIAGLAWIGFIVWAVYSVVTWLVQQ